MTVLAHASHWLVTLAYVLPVVGFVVWLGWATLKERRSARDSDNEASRSKG